MGYDEYRHHEPVSYLTGTGHEMLTGPSTCATTVYGTSI